MNKTHQHKIELIFEKIEIFIEFIACICTSTQYGCKIAILKSASNEKLMLDFLKIGIYCKIYDFKL